MNHTIRAGILYLHELEEFGEEISLDEAFSLLSLASEGKKKAARLFRQSLAIWRREAALALEQARAVSMEKGEWSRWAHLTWIQWTIPFRYGWLMTVARCGRAPYPTLLLAVQEISRLTDVVSGRSET